MRDLVASIALTGRKVRCGMKLWSGRFSKDTDSVANDFNSSIHFDSRLYAEDIEGSIAHAEMLAKQGILTNEEFKKIKDGLEGILRDVEDGKIEFSAENEDIHMNIETILTERIGNAGKKLHTARSRNDQVALDIRLYIKHEIKEMTTLLKGLLSVISSLAKEHTGTVMPGYTHLQRAQPITFAHHLLAYAQMFRRDIGRLSDCLSRMDECPLGSGALASTTYPIDRYKTAELLGFSGITQNSLDGVSDRDFLIELASASSMIMMHLSRFSEEIILWCSWEFQFISLDDAYSTGSSIMPQKKNPDIAELVRGKTGRVYGDLTTLLTMMKGLPLAYNKDMQEDKEAIFDAVDTVKQCLEVFTPMLETVTVKKENMQNAAKRGFINATDCADYLTKKGVPFRDAYTITGKLVAYSIEHGKDLNSLTIDEYKAMSDVFESDVFDAIALDTCVEQRNVPGGPAPSSTKAQIAELDRFLSNI